MNIEVQLRELLVLRDPGARFTDDVMSRVGNGLVMHSGDGVVRLADARAGKRGRRILLGMLVVVAAAASILPFLPDRRADGAAGQEVAMLEVSSGTSPPAGAAGQMPMPGQFAPVDDGEDPLDCVDPDILYGLLLPGSLGETFRINATTPAELADFEPPRQLIWMGGSERGASGTTQSAAVYRSSLAPDAARVAAVGALTAAGWQLRAQGAPFITKVFVSDNASRFGETYCREGMPVMVTANVLDGVTYVVLSVSRRTDSSLGSGNACDQPARPVPRNTSALDPYLPQLALPPDPSTAQPVAMNGSSSSGGNMSSRVSVTFTVADSLDGVARHFASQMAGQGWQPDASWSGTGSAGSTWTRRLEDDTLLQGMVAVSGFEEDHFTAVFSAVLTE